MLDAEDLEDVLESFAYEVEELPSAPPSDEADQIRAALADTGGNISRAARRLRIPRGTLRYRIRKHGLAHLLPRD